MIDAIPARVLVIGADGAILATTPRMAQSLGFSESEIVGQPLSRILRAGDGTSLSLDILLGRPSPDEKQAVSVSLDVALICRDGKSVRCMADFALAPGDHGQPSRILAVFHDPQTTAHIRDELARCAQHADTAGFDAARLLAALSHELRTPLNSILGFAQLLQISDVDEKSRMHVDAILSAGRTLTELLTGLLDLGQYKTGQRHTELTEFDLAELLDNITEWWKPSAELRGLRYSLAVDPDLPAVVVSDPLRLQRLLNGLVDNAIKFTEEGTVRLEAIVVGQQEASANVCFQVSDTGPGIPANQVEQLFHPFVRLGPPTGDAASGWGLGLAICAEIARDLETRIQVQSEIGRGTAFSFEMPMGLASGCALRSASAAPPR